MNHKETREIFLTGAEELKRLTESSQLDEAREKAQPFILDITDDYGKAKRYAERSGLFDSSLAYLGITPDTQIKISKECWDKTEQVVGAEKVDRIKKARTHLSRCSYCQESKEFLTLAEVLTNLQRQIEDKWLEDTGIASDLRETGKRHKQAGGQ